MSKTRDSLRMAILMLKEEWKYRSELIEALKFYADRKNYYAAVGRPDVLTDTGQRARDVLKERL